VRVGGSVARLTRDGFGENLTTGLDNYDKDIWAGRASLELGGYGEPALIRITGDYTKDKSNPRGGTRLIAGLATGIPVLDDVYDTRGALNDPIQDIEAYGLAMNVSLKLGDTITLRSISAWRKDDTATPIDFDAIPIVDLDVPGIYSNEQISQEFQLLYDNGGPLQGLVGFYYLDAKADTIFDTRLYTTLSTILPQLTGSTEARVDTETYAIFADFSFDFTEQLSLSLGGRYTWDERNADILKRNYIFGGSANFANPGIPLGAPDTDFTGSAKFKKFTPRASLSFQPTDDHNIYVSYSKGFKGGGFDPRGAGANAPDLDGNGVRSDAEIADFLSFLPETVDSYEIGYKGSLMDGALYVAAAAFRMDYTDVQIPGSQACTIQGVPNFCGIITNAGQARLQGFELETTARLGRDLFAGGDRLTFSGALGYIDAQYKEYIANIANTPTEVSDFREVQNTPKWTGNAGLSYLTPVGAGEIALNTAVTYRSKTFQFEIPNPFIDQGSYALWDASAVYTAPDDRWSIGIFGKNLLNKEYKTSGYTFMAADPKTGELVRSPNGNLVSALGSEGILTAFYGNPRQVFVTATVQF
jgi:iron complex outermembrane receptor protein